MLKKFLSLLETIQHSFVKTKPWTFKWPPSSGNNNPFSTTRTHTNTFLSYQQQQQQQQRSKRRAKKILERKCTRSLNREGGCRKVVQSGANATKRGGAETKKAFTNFSYQCINPPDRIILLPLSPPTFSTFPKKEPGEQWIPLSPRNEYT